MKNLKKSIIIFSVLALTLSGVAFGYGLNTSKAGEIAKYSMDLNDSDGTTLYDLSPNANNGSLVNMDESNFMTDRNNVADTALDFNGSDEYIQTSNPIVDGGDNSTSFWLKVDSLSTTQIIAENDEFRIDLTTDGVIGLRRNANGGAGSRAVSATGAIAIGKWYYVVVTSTSNSNSGNIYINGVLSGDPNQAVSNDVSASNLSIGAITGGSSGYLDGQLDDLVIYNKVLTATEVNEEYLGGLTTTQSGEQGLVASYSLDNESISGTTAYDLSSSANNGTITAGTGGLTTDRQETANMAYDFDGSTTKIDFTDTNLGTQHSVSAWVKPNAYTGNDAVMGDTGNNAMYPILLNATTIFYNNATGDLTASGDFSTGKWYFVAICRDGTTVNFYRNGVLIGSDTLSGNTALTVDVIGTDFGGKYFNGSIDDVKIYNYALTASQIAKDYEEYNPNIKSGLQGLIYHGLDGSQTIKSTTAYDRSHNHYDGTITAGASTGWTTSGNRSGYDFDGADTKIDTGSDFIGAGDVTISAWINPRTDGESSSGRIITNALSTASAGFSIYTVEGSGNLVVNIENNIASEPIKFNKFQHILVTITSAGSVTIYVDGISTNGAQSTTNLQAGSTNVIVGNTSASGRTFDGKISDVRIYPRVLSTNEIKQLSQ